MTTAQNMSTIELELDKVVPPTDPAGIEVRAFDDEQDEPAEDLDTFDEDDFDDEFDDDFDELYDEDLDEGEVSPEELDDEEDNADLDFRGVDTDD